MDKIRILGGDLFVINPKRIATSIKVISVNSVLIKLNQMGNIIETLHEIIMAHRTGWKMIISHRPKETEDSSIADLSVATGSGQIKTRSLSRSERICKYIRLLRIEEELGGNGHLQISFLI